MRKLLFWLRDMLDRSLKKEPAIPAAPAKPSEENYDLYNPEEKMIYRYWDGEMIRRADPMVLWRAMMEVGPELSIDIKVADSISKDAPQAHKNACATIRKVFGIKEFADGGLPEVKLLELADHFMLYCHSVKKNSRTSATAGTGAEPATNGAASWPTSPTSASGSTESEASTARQESSPMAQP